MEESAAHNTPGSDELKFRIQVNELEAAILDLKLKIEDIQKENSQLRRENAQLKRMPLFVAVVVDVLENGEIYLLSDSGGVYKLTSK